MCIKLLQGLTIATDSAALSLADTNLAQSTQAVTVEFSYTGITPDQFIQGSFSYAEDFAGSIVGWNDLIAFTISYNGGTQLDKAEIDSLYNYSYLAYHLSDTNNVFQRKAGSMILGLNNNSGIRINYMNLMEANDLVYSKSAGIQTSNKSWAVVETPSTRFIKINSTWNYGQEVGTWWIEKVGTIVNTSCASCDASLLPKSSRKALLY